jgi:signal transduction histidine kinase
MLQGLSHLIPQPDRPTEPSPVWISGLRIAGAAFPISEFGETDISLPTLEAGQNRIQIDFFGLGFSAGEPLRYQYKLEGAGQDWSDPTEQRTHEMSLGPGSYRFLVRAVRPDGQLASTPATVSFKILPPIWLRWWFITIGAFVVALAVYGFARYRYQRIKAVLEAQEALRRSREERFAELERVRRRIATDLHDDIGASLSQIAILSELALGDADTRPETANTLGRIATTSRELVESMGDIVWAINPRRDRVGDLLQRMRHFASDTFTGKNIEFSFRAPDAGRDLALATDVRREVLLIFKEAVNNIARHARCSHADIDVRIEHDGLVVQVADDGQGLSPSSGRGDGHGLRSMQERATRLNGCLNVDTSPGGGTRLMLRVPWRRPRTTT